MYVAPTPPPSAAVASAIWSAVDASSLHSQHRFREVAQSNFSTGSTAELTSSDGDAHDRQAGVAHGHDVDKALPSGEKLDRGRQAARLYRSRGTLGAIERLRGRRRGAEDEQRGPPGRHGKQAATVCA